MCRFAKSFHKRDAMNLTHHGIRRRFTCMPTIFEMENEETSVVNDIDESESPLVQNLECERKSKETKRGEKHDHHDVEDVMRKTTSRRNMLRMDTDAAIDRQCSQRKTHMGSVFSEFHSTRKTGCDLISIQKIRVYHQNSCLGLKSIKQDVFEKQTGIAAWLKFFG